MRPAPEDPSFSVQSFFDEVCPKLFELQADACRRLGGTLSFRVFGEAGGSWRLDLSEATVAPGLDLEADALIEMDDQDFQALMRGRLDFKEALEDGRIRFRGDIQMFAKLGTILELPEGENGS